MNAKALGRLSLFLSLAGVVAVSPVGAMTELAEGQLLSVVNQVTLGSGAAKQSDKLLENMPVATGASSFAEVKFKDASLLRLAPDTRLAFQSKDRSLRLEEGTVLLNVPHGNGGILVEAGGIQGQVTGTTLMASRDKEGNFSFVILETTGSAKVTSNTGQTASLVSGQIALVRKIDGTIRVFELNLDAVVQYSPLFNSFPQPMQGVEKVMQVADTQAGEVKNEIKSLLSYSQVGLKAEDPDKSPLSLLFGKSLEEMVSSKNPFLGELSTAAGTELGNESSSSSAAAGTVLVVDSGIGSGVSDARQPEGEKIAAKSNPANDQGNLGNTDTAAGAEDPVATDTAAGGNAGADTQSPSGPAPVSGGTPFNNPQATPGANGLISP